MENTLFQTGVVNKMPKDRDALLLFLFGQKKGGSSPTLTDEERYWNTEYGPDDRRGIFENLKKLYKQKGKLLFEKEKTEEARILTLGDLSQMLIPGRLTTLRLPILPLTPVNKAQTKVEYFENLQDETKWPKFLMFRPKSEEDIDLLKERTIIWGPDGTETNIDDLKREQDATTLIFITKLKNNKEAGDEVTIWRVGVSKYYPIPIWKRKNQIPITARDLSEVVIYNGNCLLGYLKNVERTQIDEILTTPSILTNEGELPEDKIEFIVRDPSNANHIKDEEEEEDNERRGRSRSRSPLAERSGSKSGDLSQSVKYSTPKNKTTTSSPNASPKISGGEIEIRGNNRMRKGAYIYALSDFEQQTGKKSSPISRETDEQERTKMIISVFNGSTPQQVLKANSLAHPNDNTEAQTRLNTTILPTNDTPSWFQNNRQLIFGALGATVAVAVLGTTAYGIYKATEHQKKSKKK